MLYFDLSIPKDEIDRKPLYIHFKNLTMTGNKMLGGLMIENFYYEYDQSDIFIELYDSNFEKNWSKGYG